MMKTRSLGYLKTNVQYLNKKFVSKHSEITFKYFIDILHLFEPLIRSFFLTNYICKLTIFRGDDLWILYIEFSFSLQYFYMRT